MSDKLSKLNRLRLNAGKTELKSWKAPQEKLDQAIATLESEGFLDVVPGAKVEAVPVTDDPEIAKVLPAEDKPEVTPKKIKPGLSRGLESEQGLTVHCRKSIQDHRRDEKKAIKLSKEDQKQVEDEAKLRKGEVDPKKDPEKAARQKKHIEEKKAEREKAGNVGKRKEVGKDEVSVADIARSLDMDPKIARAKLRRHEDKPNYPKTVKGERWVFPKSARKEIEKILK